MVDDAQSTLVALAGRRGDDDATLFTPSTYLPSKPKMLLRTFDLAYIQQLPTISLVTTEPQHIKSAMSNIAVPKIPSAAEAQQQAAAVQSQLSNSLSTLRHNYATTTPARVKLIDTFLLFCVLSGVLQFAYRILVTSFPYYAFVGG